MSLSDDDDDGPGDLLLSSTSEESKEEGQQPSSMPHFPMSQPRTVNEQRDNEERWRLYDQQQQQYQMQQAIIMNTLPYHQQPLPPSIPPAVVFQAPPAPPQQQQPPRDKENQSQQKTKRQKKSQDELPMELQAFRYEHKRNLICEEEVNEKAKEQDRTGPVTAARYIVMRKDKPNEKKFDLKELSSGQIRKLAMQFGCTRVGSLPMFDVRVQMALRKNSGVMYGNNLVPNPHSTAVEKRLNTLMRILNAAFSPSMVDRLIQLNDKKYRKDYEDANGRNPTKSFFTDLSEMVNDAVNNSDLSVVLDSNEDEDIHLFELVSNDLVNLNDFNLGNTTSVQQNLCDVMKVRERCVAASKVSGEHSSDLWTYCINKKFCKIRKNEIVPAAAVYYCDVLCRKHPAIDGAFSEALSADVKSDSTATPGGSAAGISSVSSSSGSSKASLISSFQETLSSFQDTNAAQRQALIDLETKKAQEQSRRSHWEEYNNVCTQFWNHWEKKTCKPLFMNLGVRIVELERLLGIPPSRSVTAATDFELPGSNGGDDEED